MRKFFVLFCVSLLLVSQSTDVIAKQKKKSTDSSNGTKVWEGSGKFFDLLGYNSTGLYWKMGESYNDTDYYVYKDNKVSTIEDFDEYIVDEVESDGVRLWVQADHWDDFTLYAEFDGTEEEIDEFYGYIPTDISIAYPYIYWKEKGKRKSYHLETEEISDCSTIYGRQESVIYKKVNNSNRVIRPFEVASLEYAWGDWVTTDNYLIWSEPSGTYIDTKEQKEGYTKLSPGTSRAIVFEEDFVLFGKENDSLGVYSVEKQELYDITLNLENPEDVDEYAYANQTLAVVTDSELKDKNKYEIYLFELENLLNGHEKSGVSPQKFNPKYMSNVIAKIDHQPEQMAVSSQYIVWTQGSNLLYQKRNNSETYILPGYWDNPVFIGQELYAYQRNEYDDDDEDEDEKTYSLNQIDLDSLKTKSLDKITFEKDLSSLKSDSNYLYWYHAEDESVVQYDPQKGEKVLFDLDTDNVLEWDASNEQVAWVEKKKRDQLLKWKSDLETTVIAKWATSEGEISGVAMDFNYIVWSVNGGKGQKVFLYDMNTKTTKTIFSGVRQKQRTPITISKDSVYFTGSKKGNSSLIQRYDVKTKKITSSGNSVVSFEVNGDTIYYTGGNSNWSKENYIFSKKVKSKGEVKLSYTWKELSKNNEKLWYDLRYTFHPKDIEITVRDEDFSWEDILEEDDDAEDIWEEAVEETPEDIEIEVNFN